MKFIFYSLQLTLDLMFKMRECLLLCTFYIKYFSVEMNIIIISIFSFSSYFSDEKINLIINLNN